MKNLLSLPPLSLYIHYPWCIKKCPYCDFNSHTNTQRNDFEYIEALINDLKNDLPLVWGRPIHSIFIGGGTPSLISSKAIELLFSQLRALLNFSPQIEVTIEANPGASDEEKFKIFSELGINRLSIGVQSFNDQYLQSLGRIHSAKEAHHAIESAKSAGFENINIDLMYGLPNQTIKTALCDIDEALKYQPNHLSYYQLTIEPNTPFYHSPPIIPNEEASFDIQAACYNKLINSNYSRYEISAWTANLENKQYTSKHNLNYWNFGDYLGIGAGAHSKISTITDNTIIRKIKHKHPKAYLKANHKNSPDTYVLEQNIIDSKDLIFEFMLNTSRLINGFSSELFTQTTGLSLNELEPYLKKAIEQGFVIKDNDKIIPTEHGINFLNDLQLIFLDS
ncbi:MAG: oxygen-independent coproporphyrinogen III oxidase-like protein [Gammaproteobacteria bacterium]|nr:oxygen-independent coproporphyrinogen III oxidase-like protein [Gammaproteobacteria bacterium]